MNLHGQQNIGTDLKQDLQAYGKAAVRSSAQSRRVKTDH